MAGPSPAMLGPDGIGCAKLELPIRPAEEPSAMKANMTRPDIGLDIA
jgi:hypothetical protein